MITHNGLEQFSIECFFSIFNIIFNIVKIFVIFSVFQIMDNLMWVCIMYLILLLMVFKSVQHIWFKSLVDNVFNEVYLFVQSTIKQTINLNKYFFILIFFFLLLFIFINNIFISGFLPMVSCLYYLSVMFALCCCFNTLYLVFITIYGDMVARFSYILTYLFCGVTPVLKDFLENIYQRSTQVLPEGGPGELVCLTGRPLAPEELRAVLCSKYWLVLITYTGRDCPPDHTLDGRNMFMSLGTTTLTDALYDAFLWRGHPKIMGLWIGVPLVRDPIPSYTRVYYTKRGLVRVPEALAPIWQGDFDPEIFDRWRKATGGRFLATSEKQATQVTNYIVKLYGKAW